MSERSRLKQRIDMLKETGNPVPLLLWKRYEELRPHRRKEKPRQQAKSAPKVRRPRFYSSPEWRSLRYAVIAERGARCECCGVTPKDGAKINVDHVLPISKAWDRRLDPTNLQILCGACNQGKGARTDDWREG